MTVAAAASLSASLTLASPTNAGPADKVTHRLSSRSNTNWSFAAVMPASEHQGTTGPLYWTWVGIGSRWFSEIAVEYVDGPVSAGEFEAVEWDNVFQLTEQGRDWLDLGLFAGYEFNLQSGVPDELVFGPLFQKDAPRCLSISLQRGNFVRLICGHPVGSNRVSKLFASKIRVA